MKLKGLLIVIEPRHQPELSGWSLCSIKKVKNYMNIGVNVWIDFAI